MTNLIAKDVKIFVPAKNFEISLSFYELCGWKINWIHENSLAELELANSRMFLQDFYVEQWAHNFMIYVQVESVNEWYIHIKKILEDKKEFSQCKIQAPKKEPHGEICYVWDPSGVLIHLAE